MIINPENLPSGFSLHRSGRVLLVYKEQLTPPEMLSFVEALPGHLEGRQGTFSRSSASPTVWELSDEDSLPFDMIVRQYVHGGLYGRCIGPLRTLYLDRSQMLGEIRIATHLQNRGIPASNPVVLRFERKAGPFFTAFLVSEKIPGAWNLLALCRRVRAGTFDMPRRTRQSLLEKIGVSVAKLHEAGVYHGDLNLKNIIVETGEDAEPANLYLIDYKKCRLVKRVPVQKGIKNIRRLWRSIRKRPDSAAVFGPSGHATLTEAYRRERRHTN